MAADLKFILPSREQLIGMGLEVHMVKQCLPPIQHNDLVLDCLGTKLSSSNSLEECQEEYPISFYYFKGIFHWEDVGTLSIWKCPLTEIQLHTPILIGWFSTIFAEFNKVTLSFSKLNSSMEITHISKTNSISRSILTWRVDWCKGCLCKFQRHVGATTRLKNDDEVMINSNMWKDWQDPSQSPLQLALNTSWSWRWQRSQTPRTHA